MPPDNELSPEQMEKTKSNVLQDYERNLLVIIKDGAIYKNLLANGSRG